MDLQMRIVVGDVAVEPDMAQGQVVLQQGVNEIRIPGFGIGVQSVVDSIINTNLAMVRAAQTGRRYERVREDSAERGDRRVDGGSDDAGSGDRAGGEAARPVA